MKTIFILCISLLAIIHDAAAVKITYVHTDVLGSPVAETDESGNIIWTEHYSPFGEKVDNSDESVENSVGYTGHQFDSDTGLTYMQARYYDPVIGRFYSNDPIGFRDIHSFNRYAYANNNPYKYTDPTGGYSSPVANLHKGIRDGQAILSGQKTQQDFVNEAQTFGDITGATDVINSVKSALSGDLSGAVVSAAMAVNKPLSAAEKIQKNIKRFTKKVPANAKGNIEQHSLPDGGIAVQATSPGKVPGSKAVYEKQINSSGTTIQATKTTYDPKGNIVHVKDKLNGGTYK